MLRLDSGGNILEGTRDENEVEEYVKWLCCKGKVTGKDGGRCVCVCARACVMMQITLPSFSCLAAV